MASSDDPPEVSGCLVFSIEALRFLIFKRLPVKSLCRFRCVCRSWNSLITSPSFVSEHFSFVASAPEKSYVILNGGDGKLCALYHPHKSPQNRVTYLYYPFQAKMLRVADVIHGVVCFQSYFYDPEEPLILWNPATRKHHIIPQSHSGRPNYWQRVGFGFQSSKNDFKAANISFHPQGLGPPVFEVFSLQSGLWMAVACDDSIVCSCTQVSTGSCFVAGTIHWIALFASAQEGGNHTYALLCFDCEHDKLSKMELPQEEGFIYSPFTHSPTSPTFIHSPTSIHSPPPIWILRYGGKLSVHNWTMGGALELWVMDKYGAVCSWNKLFRIGRPDNPRSITMRGEDGDIMVYNDVRDLAKKTKKCLRDRKLYLPVIASVIEETLYLFEQTSQVPIQQEDYSVYEKLA